MQSYSFDFFNSYLQQVFTASLGDRSVDMVLTEIRRGRARAPDGEIRTEPFVLYFKCAGEVFPSQGTYTFGNPATGDIEIFVVPVARQPDGVLYEAVFN